jgi:hypothetical protein
VLNNKIIVLNKIKNQIYETKNQGKKIVAEMPQKETRIKHMQDTIKKIFISYTKIGICKYQIPKKCAQIFI